MSTCSGPISLAPTYLSEDCQSAIGIDGFCHCLRDWVGFLQLHSAKKVVSAQKLKFYCRWSWGSLPSTLRTIWTLFLFLAVLTAIFTSDPGLACFIGAEDDGGGGDSWSYKTCNASVKSPSPTNQHPTFYGPDALPATQPTGPYELWESKRLVKTHLFRVS